MQQDQLHDFGLVQAQEQQELNHTQPGISEAELHWLRNERHPFVRDK